MELLGFILIGAVFLVIFIAIAWVAESFWTAVGVFVIAITGTVIYSIGIFLIVSAEKGGF